MTERTKPCVYYVNCGADCKKGIKDVLHKKQCQHCPKYRPRKVSNPRRESRDTRMKKIRDRDFREQRKEF